MHPATERLAMAQKYIGTQFRFIEDPGHGWLEVPRPLVRHLNIDVSTYSYYDAASDNLYLEEDIDAGRFVKAFKEAFKSEPKTKHQYLNPCFVRSLCRTM